MTIVFWLVITVGTSGANIVVMPEPYESGEVCQASAKEMYKREYNVYHLGYACVPGPKPEK